MKCSARTSSLCAKTNPMARGCVKHVQKPADFVMAMKIVMMTMMTRMTMMSHHRYHHHTAEEPKKQRTNAKIPLSQLVLIQRLKMICSARTSSGSAKAKTMARGCVSNVQRRVDSVEE